MAKILIGIGVLVAGVVAVSILMPGFFTGLFNSTFDHDGKHVPWEGTDPVSAKDLHISAPMGWTPIESHQTVVAIDGKTNLAPKNGAASAPFNDVIKATVATYEYWAYSPVGGASAAVDKNVQVHIIVFKTVDAAKNGYNAQINEAWSKYGKFQQAVTLTIGGQKNYAIQDMNVVVLISFVLGDGIAQKNIDAFMVNLEKKIHDAAVKITV